MRLASSPVTSCFLPLGRQVKHLEDKNKKLETKLKILKEHEGYGGRIDDVVKQIQNELEEQIDCLLRDREKLHAELVRKQKEVEDSKKRSVGPAELTEFVLLFTVSGTKYTFAGSVISNSTFLFLPNISPCPFQV